MRKTLLTLAVAALAMPAVLSAATFEEVDTDADGSISMEEAMAAMPDVAAEDLQALDADGDGALSPDEFAAMPQ
jgi:Ca2+-binding EF-hand superfamily protein